MEDTLGLWTTWWQDHFTKRQNMVINLKYLGRVQVKETGQEGNHQVFGDIGNLEVIKIAEGKQISRPITRFSNFSSPFPVALLCLFQSWLLLACKTVGKSTNCNKPGIGFRCPSK